MKRHSIAAMVLAFLVPGGGHFFLGRRAKAIVFFIVIIVLFLSGLAIEGKVYRFESGQPLTNLATFASMGVGLPYALARLLGGFGNIESITFEYGTAFTLTAGLMNLLLVLDSYDIAEGRKE
ncbi:MAG TPA: DUF6677 family protein [Thermoanaerobaculia bacterium]|nr:DUF6677 family protein [Thermoanaerobaculia bacterium]